MWGVGVILHIGFKRNPRQRKFLVARSPSRLLTFGTVEGEIALVPFLFQMNTLVFLLIGVTESILTGFATPVWASRVWLLGVFTCALLTPILNRRS